MKIIFTTSKRSPIFVLPPFIKLFLHVMIFLLSRINKLSLKSPKRKKPISETCWTNAIFYSIQIFQSFVLQICLQEISRISSSDDNISHLDCDRGNADRKESFANIRISTCPFTILFQILRVQSVSFQNPFIYVIRNQ